MRVLHVDASARIQGSHSREISRHFVDALRGRVSPLAIDRLDLTRDTPRHFGALETAADTLVIGTPIYNFGMPSTLKAFFDHVSRNGRTFLADETGMRGLLGNKKAVILIAAGGAYGPGEMFDGLDALTPHVRAILGFMGITDPAFIAARPMMFAGPDAAVAAMRSAKAHADDLAASWAR